ncbi:heavy metal translocating P-type ATPase, partial [Pseudomonadota bacterium]
DGEVIKGQSSVSEALLSGESRPLAKVQGDTVIAGSINHDGLLTVKVVRSGSDTMLSSIQRLFERAQNDKPRFVSVADRIAGWFVLAVLVTAVGTAVYWWTIEPGRWLAITVSVLVISCPCALALAVPTVLSAAVGNLMGNDVLVTRSQALYGMANIDHVILDKTGTLTEGSLKLRETVVFGDLSDDQCIRLATALERYSTHPVASAFKQASNSNLPKVENIKNYPGQGLVAEWQGLQVVLGSIVFLRPYIEPESESDQNLVAHPGSYTNVYLAVDGKLAAMFLLEDFLRQGAVDWVEFLHNNDIPITLLTGDRLAATKSLAAKLGLREVRTEVSPQGKLNYIRELQASGQSVAVVGDGVNDAPVLARADVSIAIGSGAPLATSQADIVMLAQDLGTLVGVTQCARKTQWITRQNIAWAVSYNVIALPLAITGLVSPWMAAIGMSLSSIFVVLNALRVG